MSATSSPPSRPPPKIWWTNVVSFTGLHIATLFALYYRPWYTVHPATLALCFFAYQIAGLGITIGYHRMYSHKAFRAPLAIRFILSLLGASALQGSIKWWVLRHRLHHRFTDDPINDPYCATKGLLWSHMGWIFFIPRYDKLGMIERKDLDSDPVVRFQNTYYIPLALLVGFALPAAIGSLWGDALGAFIYGGMLSRIITWHATFLVNSLAHWDGLQPYSDENTSRGTLILSLLTGGEGNHNFHHSFPHDYRAGPSPYDWDPSKWIIFTLNRLGLTTDLRRAREQDVADAIHYMRVKGHEHHHFGPELSDVSNSEDDDESGVFPKYEKWTELQLAEYVKATATAAAKCVVVINGYVVDVTSYMKEHPGGAALMRKYSYKPSEEKTTTKEEAAAADSAAGSDVALWQEASWAFYGGMNQHSRAGRKRMRELTVAKLIN